MRHVIEDGGSATSGRGDRSRFVALVATFLLLSAGMVVSAPGLMSASATSGSSTGHSGDGGSGGGKDDSKDDSKDDGGSDCENHDGTHDDDSGDDKSGDGNSSDGNSSDGNSSDGNSSDGNSSDGNSNSVVVLGSTNSGGSDGSGNDNGQGNGGDDGKDQGNGGSDGSSNDNGQGNGGDDGQHQGSDGSGNDNGQGNGGDDGQDQGHGSHDGNGDDGDDDGGDCTPPPPTTAKLILNKVVINDNNGTSSVGDFTLTATSSVGGVAVISGPDPAPNSAVGIFANIPVTESYVLSESGPAGYDASAWHCSAGTLNGDTLTLAAGDVANCTITNDDTPPPPAPAFISVDKVLSNQGQWGGTFGPADFDLRIDDLTKTHAVPVEVSPGPHTISEFPRSGYQQTSVVCLDSVTSQPVNTGANVVVAAGDSVACTVTNEELPATLKLIKWVDLTNGGDAVPSDFHLQIDGLPAAQNAAIDVKAGAHTISEVPTAGYRLTSIECTDDDTRASITYNNGLSLALGQHVTCNLTNVSDPVDLAITKIDDGLAKLAGGPAFNYTITVDNVGSRDATLGEPVTVTDQLPVGFDFVSFPANCTAVGQTLTCVVDPADLQVADPPVVITVSVKSHPDIAAGTYTNLAFVDTVDDPACVGTACVPVCSDVTNNIACASTAFTRQAQITIDKVDNVTGPITPGTTYEYFITVGNAGPSTFLANMSMTDALPVGLIFVSVSAPLPWTCNSSDPISCIYGAVLQPNTTAPVVTVTVTLDPNFTGTSIFNEAKAVAIVNPPGTLTSLDTAPPADPGTVVTATDDETTLIVRNADLSIDKSVSQATATAGDPFSWILDVTNHGPDLATNLVVSDTVPAAFEVTGVVPGAGLSCTNTGNSVQCTAASLVNGGTLHAVIQVRVLASALPSAVTNNATVVTDSNDPNTVNNSDSASITVTASSSQAPVPPAPTPAPAGSGSGVVSLPRTGNASLAGSLSLAALMFVGGIVSLVIARRRRVATA